MARQDQQQTYTSEQHFCSSCGRVQDDLQKKCCDPCRNSSHREAGQVTSTEENEPHTLLAFVLCQMECAGLCDTPRDVQPCWEQRVWADKPRQHALPCLCAVARWLHGFQMRTGWCPAAGEHGQSKITPVGMHLCALPSQNTLALSRTLSPKCLKVPYNYNYLAPLDDTVWGCHRKWNLGICPSHKNVSDR